MNTLNSPRLKVLEAYNVGDLGRVEDLRFITGRLMLCDFLLRQEYAELQKEISHGAN